MERKSKEEIRGAVRERYGSVAKAGVSSADVSPVASCCGATDASTNRNSRISCGCGDPAFTLEQMSTTIGYSRDNIGSVPEGANMGLGCGNPVALASLKTGETVVDLGSGGGFDCFLAAKEVGDNGTVVGVDMTAEMITRARENAEEAGTKNVDFRLGEIEHLPVADNSADIIMSNCVINLSPDKLSVYREGFRVLKPGGRLAIADIVATAPLPPEIRNDLALVGACVGGAATIDDTVQMLAEAGFQDISIQPNDNSRKLIREWTPDKSENALDYVVSANIGAVKPSMEN